MVAAVFPQHAITISIATLSTQSGVTAGLWPYHRMKVTGTLAVSDSQNQLLQVHKTWSHNPCHMQGTLNTNVYIIIWHIVYRVLMHQYLMFLVSCPLK
jgi:hypothetical protein